MKTCTRCGRTLDESAFGKDKRAKGGLRYWCRTCESTYARLRREDPIVKAKEAMRIRNWKEAHPEQVSAAKNARTQKRYLDPKMKQWWPD